MGRTVVRTEQVSDLLATDLEVESDIAVKKGAPDGLAPLDANSHVPLANLPLTDLAAYVAADMTMDGGVF